MITATPTIDALIVPKELPFRESSCWQTADVYQFTPEQMLSCYEWRWESCKLFGNLEDEELCFLKELAKCYHSWLQADLRLNSGT